MTVGALVELTPEAAEKVVELRGDDPTKSFLRVYVAGQGCCSVQYGMAFAESVDNGDEVIESHGVKLAVDSASRESVSGVMIDFVDTPQGAGFLVQNPTASGGGGGCGGGGCGCGHGHGHGH